MNAKQSMFLALYIQALTTVRGFADTTHAVSVDGNGLAHVTLTAVPDFPEITIGKGGRFDIPTVRSFTENGKGNALAYPGNTAFDAVLFADKYASKPARGRAAAKIAELTAQLAALKAATPAAPAPEVEAENAATAAA